MKRLSIVLFVLAVSYNILSAQTIVGDSIIIESKKGSLAKMLKKWEYPDIKKIRVVGEVGEKDMLALQSKPFTTIDLSDAVFNGSCYPYSDKNNEKFMQCVFNVPYYTTLLKMFKCGKNKDQLYPIELFLRGNVEASHTIYISANTSLGMNFGDRPDRDESKSILKIVFYDRKNDNSILCKRSGGALDNIRWGVIVDIWVVPDKSYLSVNKQHNNIFFDYNVLHVLNNNEVYIKKFKKDYGDFYLENAVEIVDEHPGFDNLWGSATFNKLKVIPPFCFSDSKLSEIHLRSVEKIGGQAFYSSRIRNITLPATIRFIDESAFAVEGGKFSTVELEGTMPPILDTKEDEYWHFNDICFVVPQGSLPNYSSGIWGKIKVREKGFNPNISIHCEQPGTLNSYLTPEVLNNTDSLVLSGTIYDTEKELVKKIKWLKNVDWSGVTVVKSPETIAAEREAEKKRIQWEKDRPKREAAERQLAEKRRKYGVGSVSEGYNIGYKDGYRCVNCYWSYVGSTSPLYSEGFLDGYMQGFSRGQNDQQNDQLMRMRR